MVSVGEVGYGTFRIHAETRRVGENVLRRLPQYKLRVGDIVFGRKGAVDRSATVRLPQSGWFLGSDGIRVRLGDGVDQLFVGYALQRLEARQWLVANSTGTTMATLNQQVLDGVPLVLPALGEQRAIVVAIDDVSGLIDSLERLISKKRDVKQGMMQALLTGATRLPGHAALWSPRRISEVLAPRAELNVSGEALEVLTCTKHEGFVRSLDYFKNQVFSRDLSTYRLIFRGDIGYPANHIEEGSIGVQELFDRAVVSPIYVVMRPIGQHDGFFLQRQMKLETFRQRFARVMNASVDRRGSLRWKEFSQINVLVPEPDEQRAIAQVLRDADAEVAALERRLESARAIKQGMMQELLSGRTRLVLEAAA